MCLEQHGDTQDNRGAPTTIVGAQDNRGHLGQQGSAWDNRDTLDNRRHPGQQEASGTTVYIWIVLIYVLHQVARCGDLLHRYVVDCCFVSCCITPVNYCF